MLAQQLNLTTFTPYAPWYDKKQVLGPLHFQFNSLLLINLLLIIFRAFKQVGFGPFNHPQLRPYINHMSIRIQYR